MAKFIINKNASSQQSVTADSYKLRDGFFHFYDDNASPAKVVLTYKADSIISIWRQDSDTSS